MLTYKPTEKQRQAQILLGGPQMHTMLFGGSRSGKTFLIVRAILARAIKAPGSRQAILRQAFDHVKRSVGMDTLPKVAALCFPGVTLSLDKQMWVFRLPNESEIWLGGLDDKERTEKVLGQEHCAIFLNECSQIAWDARNIALTRVAQNAKQSATDNTPLALRMLYDCNPPSKAHWSYKVFITKLDPDTKRALPNADDYESLQMNPMDNAENLPPKYLKSLQGMPARMRRRFFDGAFADATPNALFPAEIRDKWRADGELPEMIRVGVAVDPSGAGDTDNADNDEIGIVVGGLGKDGNAYVLEDLTVKAGPATWGKIATSAYDRHNADFVCAEVNYGGAMVKHVIQTARANTPYREVHATRGKVVRAEPISALMETGKVRLAGQFNDLEDELEGFSTTGYMGTRSPNRADAFIWLMSEFFPGIVKETPKWAPLKYENRGIV